MTTNEEKDKLLRDRNQTHKAFKSNKEKQKERDQLVMPIDELPLEDIQQEAEEERQKEKSKQRSSSE
ncbi:hypothetical protein [Halalkalibacterium ligniniphilum]|uniref:hypothetical protein n=1 Tax=Halalkalibacterium ligniniphilum TaxID=1134413 RepID=UPI00034BA196|nr:hypothetical protein [Halalkalibacterium ligniniphilum]